MIDPVTGLAIAGIAGSVFGGKDNKALPTSGFGTLPKAVQDAWLKTYLPDVQEQYNAPFQPLPMTRAVDPSTDPFASQGLYDLQQYSDAIGGLFTPLDGSQLQQSNQTAPQQMASSNYLNDLRNNTQIGDLAGRNRIAMLEQAYNESSNPQRTAFGSNIQEQQKTTGGVYDLNQLLAALGVA